MKSSIHHRIARCFAIAALFACFGLATTEKASAQKNHANQMSGMGQMAHRHVLRLQRAVLASPTGNFKTFTGDENLGTGSLADDEESDQPFTGDPQDDDTPNIAGGQAETSINCDSTGQHIVVGFNDTRGFAFAQTDVSGFIYSDDGGITWTDGGQLPINVGSNTTIAGAVYPEPFGDADIVYLGGSKFAYFSILLKARTATATAQTMCVHLSNDYGHTWKGPYEIAPATNPNSTADAADKEFAAIDPDTGRVMLSWSNFTSVAPGGVQISRTYSDDMASAAALAIAPTWSTRLTVGARSVDGQSSVPRFAGNGSNDAYVVWRTASGFTTVNESVAISHDNGVTFGAPVNLRGTDFKPMDHVLGNDRTNNSPGFDTDRTGGVNNGNLYVAYTDDNTNDGGDIAFQKSTNGGATWSSAVNLNARPGLDRAQWFPWVNVDQSTGRVHVFYYDQGIATAGDLSEVVETHSDNGGSTWSVPAPFTDRPFHTGYGNDTGQPNIGDYNQAVDHLGDFMATYAGSPQTIGFQNGQPSASMNYPDILFKRTSTFNAGLRLGTVSSFDSSADGKIDPGESVTLLIPINSYANSAPLYTGVSGTLTSATPNVSIITGNSGYPDVPTLGSSTNSTPFKIKLAPGFVPGTSIELSLAITTAGGNTTLLYTLPTGQAQVTPIYSATFETAGDFTGWATSHAGGTPTRAWVIGNSGTQFAAAPFAASGNFFFHQNENDGTTPTANATRFERLFSPVWAAPANSDYITVDFDVAYNLEDEPAYNLYAYDGLCLRVTDQTGGTFLLRSVLAEAFAKDFITGGVSGYPKHLPRNSNTNYLQDMSVWSGFSNGWKHVSMKLPGMAGTNFQFRFEYTQDSTGTGHDTHPTYPTAGVGVDNLVVTSVHLIAPPNAPPIAKAGNDQTVECAGLHNFVTLDGSASSDPDGEPITYAWYQGVTALGTTASISVDPPHNATTTYTLVVTDAHSNTSTDTVDVTVQDTTPPVITLNGANPMTVECATGYTEPGASANDVCDGAVTVHISGTVPTTKGSYNVTYTATDDAGNMATKMRVVNVTDTIAPVVTLNGPALVKIYCGTTFTDPGASSLDSCDGNITAGIVVTGTVGSSIGSYTLTYTSTDGSGNHSNKTRTVKVIYPWSDVLQPVNADGTSIFKLGSTIPVKFNLTGACANDVISAHIYVTKITNNVLGDEIEAVSTSAADTGNTFRQAGGGYIFNLATKPLSTGTWQIRIDLGDGELHTVLISLK
jgi:hypothetical protein